jgi:hypothetical protein
MSDKKMLIMVNLVVIVVAAAMLSSAVYSGDDSIVALERSGNSVKNAGNVELAMQSDGMTGMFILGVNESISAEREENVRAEQA